jgi:hypothetical protein
MIRIALALSGVAIGASLSLGDGVTRRPNAGTSDSPPMILAGGAGTPTPNPTPKKYMMMNFGNMSKGKK